MTVFIVLWPYPSTTKPRCFQKNNIGHTNAGAAATKKQIMYALAFSYSLYYVLLKYQFCSYELKNCGTLVSFICKVSILGHQ